MMCVIYSSYLVLLDVEQQLVCGYGVALLVVFVTLQYKMHCIGMDDIQLHIQYPFLRQIFSSKMCRISKCPKNNNMHKK
jgi:hypothetical protein